MYRKNYQVLRIFVRDIKKRKSDLRLLLIVVDSQVNEITCTSNFFAILVDMMRSFEICSYTERRIPL